MELGYFTMPLHPPGSNFTQTLEDDLEQIVTLDRLGYKEPGSASTSPLSGRTFRRPTCSSPRPWR